MYSGTLTKEKIQERATRLANLLQYINDPERRSRVENELKGISGILYGRRPS